MHSSLFQMFQIFLKFQKLLGSKTFQKLKEKIILK